MQQKLSFASASKGTAILGILLVAVTLAVEFLIIVLYRNDQFTVVTSLIFCMAAIILLILWLSSLTSAPGNPTKTTDPPSQKVTLEQKLVLTPPREFTSSGPTTERNDTQPASPDAGMVATSPSAERLVLKPATAEAIHQPEVPSLSPALAGSVVTSERIVLRQPTTEPGYKYSSPTGRLFCYLLPKGDEPTERCEDRFQQDERRGRYAVADGVSQSFLPARWAQIVADQFVGHRGQLQSEAEFATWLQTCSDAWHAWVSTQWIPDANKKMVRDWSEQLSKGAQSTLVGCTLLKYPEEQGERTQIEVVAIGDTNFFLLHPPSTNQQQWQYKAFPHTQPEAFGITPQTLPSSKERIVRTWQRLQDITWHSTFYGEPGDFILLASDALAKWLLAQLQHGQREWIPLLYNIDTQRFRDFIRAERKSGRMEDDDVTAMVIPL